MLEAARMLVDRCPRFMLVVVGAGARLAEARRLARGLNNVRFIAAQPRGDLCASLGAADVHLVTLQASFASLVVPSKLYGAMAAARPVLFIGPAQSEVDRVVTAEQVGWTARLGEAQRVADLLCAVESDVDERQRRGNKAREVMMQRYERSLATRQLRTLLCEVAECR